MGIPTPNYVLTEDHKVLIDRFDTKILPSGSFVRPIETCYLPSHILNSEEFKSHHEGTTIYVYCSFGMILIPLNIIRKV